MLSEEVHIESSSKDIKDSFKGALNSYQEVDSTSVSQSSRPSVANASASGYDGLRGGIDDEVIMREKILGNENKVNIY